MARQEEGRVAGDANLCMIPGLAYFPRLTFVGPLFVPLPPVETFCAPLAGLFSGSGSSPSPLSLDSSGENWIRLPPSQTSESAAPPLRRRAVAVGCCCFFLARSFFERRLAPQHLGVVPPPPRDVAFLRSFPFSCRFASSLGMRLHRACGSVGLQIPSVPPLHLTLCHRFQF